MLAEINATVWFCQSGSSRQSSIFLFKFFPLAIWRHNPIKWFISPCCGAQENCCAALFFPFLSRPAKHVLLQIKASVLFFQVNDFQLFLPTWLCRQQSCFDRCRSSEYWQFFISRDRCSQANDDGHFKSGEKGAVQVMRRSPVWCYLPMWRQIRFRLHYCSCQHYQYWIWQYVRDSRSTSSCDEPTWRWTRTWAGSQTWQCPPTDRCMGSYKMKPSLMRDGRCWPSDTRKDLPIFFLSLIRSVLVLNRFDRSLQKPEESFQKMTALLSTQQLCASLTTPWVKWVITASTIGWTASSNLSEKSDKNLPNYANPSNRRTIPML